MIGIIFAALCTSPSFIQLVRRYLCSLGEGCA
jgi:hypothetical protein